MATWLFIATLLAMLCLSWLAQAWVSSMVGKRLSIPAATFRSTALFTLATAALNIGLVLACVFSGMFLHSELMVLFLILIGNLAILAKWFQLRMGKAIVFFLAIQLVGYSIALPPALLVRAFVFEAFKIPTNSMAPTLLGVHVPGVCPRCQQPAYGSPADPNFDGNPAELFAICGQEYRSCKIPNGVPNSMVDRMFASKLHQPRRWDLIVFHYPEEPETIYVKRLVGLPGEEITIKVGAVWANGERLTPPDEFASLYYVTESAEWGNSPVKVWGDEKRPAKLADDEYFVLGDNSERAKDSRFWERGAEGHPPYAVPKSYILGVVTTIYWPPNRWRAFR